MLARRIAPFLCLFTACASSHPLTVKLKSEEPQMTSVWTLEKEGETFKLGPYAIEKVQPTVEPNQIGPLMMELKKDGKHYKAGGSIVAKPEGGLWTVSGLIAIQDAMTATTAEPVVLELEPTPNKQIAGTLKIGGATYTVESAPKLRNALGEDVGIDAIVFQDQGKIVAAASIDRADAQLMMRPELTGQAQEAIAAAASALLLRRGVVASSGMATKDVKLPAAPTNVRSDVDIYNEAERERRQNSPEPGGN